MSQSDFSPKAIQMLGTQPNSQWFDYPIRVQPHHTDYGGVVWHGTYVAWLEEARVEALRSVGIDYADWVALGCEMPVVELSIRYHRAMRLGMQGIVKTRLMQAQGVRIIWDYRIESPDAQELYVTAQVTLVTIDREKGKIMRRLPAPLEAALMQVGRSIEGM
jgi:acyl-CoA thioester hydrolase